ncbi:N-Acetylaspartylglutamate Synthase A [Manis pentadactyla]|nr:N-Acetylaspartylglutamate Synthase A [Manis pentadactyla]
MDGIRGHQGLMSSEPGSRAPVVEQQSRLKPNPAAPDLASNPADAVSTYWNQDYGYQQGYGPGYGGSDYSPHGYYSYGPGYYYRQTTLTAIYLDLLLLSRNTFPGREFRAEVQRLGTKQHVQVTHVAGSEKPQADALWLDSNVEHGLYTVCEFNDSAEEESAFDCINIENSCETNLKDFEKEVIYKQKGIPSVDLEQSLDPKVKTGQTSLVKSGLCPRKSSEPKEDSLASAHGQQRNQKLLGSLCLSLAQGLYSQSQTRDPYGSSPLSLALPSHPQHQEGEEPD